MEDDLIEDCQQYLDVVCFPVLFPNGLFGEYHPLGVELSHSGYAKSCSLNKHL